VIDPLVLALARRRTQLGWTQQQLADKAGICQSQISETETGTHPPTLRTLRRLADALDLELSATPKPHVRVSQPGGIWPKEPDVLVIAAGVSKAGHPYRVEVDLDPEEADRA